MSCQVRPSNTYLPKKPIDASLPEVGQAVGVPEGARGQPQPTATKTRYGRHNRTRASASAPGRRQMRPRLLRLFFPFREGFVTPSPPRVLTLDVEQDLSLDPPTDMVSCF